MGKLIQKRVAGATIVEAVVAMVIILVLFAITTTVLVQTSLRSFSIKKIKAVQLVNAGFIKTIREKTFFNEETAVDALVVKKVVEVYSENSNVLAIKIVVLDNNNNELTGEQRLIRAK